MNILRIALRLLSAFIVTAVMTKWIVPYTMSMSSRGLSTIIFVIESLLYISFLGWTFAKVYQDGMNRGDIQKW